MLALKINDVKGFMNHLLIGDTFDHFPMAEVSVTTFNTFSIDGMIKKEFFDTDTQNILTQNKSSLFCMEGNKTFLFFNHTRKANSTAIQNCISAFA